MARCHQDRYFAPSQAMPRSSGLDSVVYGDRSNASAFEPAARSAKHFRRCGRRSWTGSSMPSARIARRCWACGTGSTLRGCCGRSWPSSKTKRVAVFAIASSRSVHGCSRKPSSGCAGLPSIPPLRYVRRAVGSTRPSIGRSLMDADQRAARIAGGPQPKAGRGDTPRVTEQALVRGQLRTCGRRRPRGRSGRLAHRGATVAQRARDTCSRRAGRAGSGRCAPRGPQRRCPDR